MTQPIQSGEYYIEKLLKLPEQFREAYWKREYPRAKYIYDTALRVAGFLEVPKEIKDRLFGNYEDEDNLIEALFPLEDVRKTYEMCVVRSHQATENECFRRFGQAPRYYPEPRYPVKQETKKISR